MVGAPLSEVKRLVERAAAKILPFTRHRFELNDLYQEGWLIYVRCLAYYFQLRNPPDDFLRYLAGALHNQMLLLAQSQTRHAREITNQDDTIRLGSVGSVTRMSTECSHSYTVLSELSPEASLYLTCLLDPPPGLIEFSRKRIQAGRPHSRSVRGTLRAFFGWKQSFLRQLEKELQEKVVLHDEVFA